MSRTAASYTKPLKGNGAWSDYNNRKRERNNYTYRIDCTGGYYVVNGQRMEEDEFNNMLPIGLINRSSHVHLDPRQKYMV